MFWDSGATISLITFTAAETLGLIGNEAQIKVTIAGGRQEPTTSKSYLISLVDVKIVECKVYGIDRILTKVQGIKLDCVLHLFKNLHEKEVQRPNGEIEALIGFEHAGYRPVRQQSVGHLLLLKNRF